MTRLCEIEIAPFNSTLQRFVLERVTGKIYCACCIEQERIQNVNYAVKQYRYPQYKQYNIDIHQKKNMAENWSGTDNEAYVCRSADFYLFLYIRLHKQRLTFKNNVEMDTI